MYPTSLSEVLIDYILNRNQQRDKNILSYGYM